MSAQGIQPQACAMSDPVPWQAEASNRSAALWHVAKQPAASGVHRPTACIVSAPHLGHVHLAQAGRRNRLRLKLLKQLRAEG